MARGLTQEAAAQWFGIYRRTTVDWEAGRCVPSNAHLKLLFFMALAISRILYNTFANYLDLISVLRQ